MNPKNNISNSKKQYIILKCKSSEPNKNFSQILCSNNNAL